MTEKLNKDKIADVIEDSAKDGNISTASKDMIIGNLNNNVVLAANGLAADQIPVSEVSLVTCCIDMSSSIDFKGLKDPVMMGHKEMVTALEGSKKRDSILMAQWLFNSDVAVLNAYVPLEKNEKMDANLYQPSGATDLNGVIFDAVSANVAYAQQLLDAGTPVQSIVVVITDGEDTIGRVSESSVKALVKDVLRTERFVTAYIGVGDDDDHKQISENLGFPTFLQVGATQSEIRKLFQMVSASIIRASQTQISSQSGNDFFKI